MKLITFNALSILNPQYKVRTLELSSDFDYFREVHSKAHKSKNLAWWSYEYTIEDEQAEFLKIKYPEIVTIKEWTKW